MSCKIGKLRGFLEHVQEAPVMDVDQPDVEVMGPSDRRLGTVFLNDSCGHPFQETDCV